MCFIQHLLLKKHKDINLFNIYSSSYKEAKDFLDDLRQNLPSALFNQIKCAEHISKRRWNVKTKNDLLIKLPEKQATNTLIKLNKYLSAKSGPKKMSMCGVYKYCIHTFFYKCDKLIHL